MRIPDTTSYIPLAAAACYTLLLVTTLIWRGQQARQRQWLLVFLALSIVWEFLLFFAPGITYPPHLFTVALLVGTMFLGVTTAVYVDWPQQRRWLLLSSGAVLANLLLDLFTPPTSFRSGSE